MNLNDGRCAYQIMCYASVAGAPEIVRRPVAAGASRVGRAPQ